MPNPHIAKAESNLTASTTADNLEYQNTLIAAAGVNAQLAIAYELQTIGRVLALKEGVAEAFEHTDGIPALVAHNAIIERLGLIGAK